jgi:hypothetical protein
MFLARMLQHLARPTAAPDRPASGISHVQPPGCFTANVVRRQKIDVTVFRGGFSFGGDSVTFFRRFSPW